MATTTVDVLIEGGKATAAPPLGPALGPTGANIGQVVSMSLSYVGVMRIMKFLVVISMLILFSLLSTSVIAYDSCTDVPSIVLNGRECRPITSCSHTFSSNTYNLLVQNISSSATCFSILGASNLVLDLNQHHVTFGNSYGVTQRGVYIDGGVVGLRITNGVFKQGAGAGIDPYVINYDEYENGYKSDWEIDHIKAYYYGDSGHGVSFRINNIKIHDNEFYPNVRVIDNRHHKHAAVEASAFSGYIEVYNNIVIGHGQSGIDVARITPDPIRGLIYNNTVSMYAHCPNGIGLAIECSNCAIFDNNVTSPNARGLYYAGSNCGTCAGPVGGIIYNNYINVEEDYHPEYTGDGYQDPPGDAHGVRIRYGADDILFFNNTIISNAMPGKGDAVGVRVSVKEGYVNNITIENNTIIARAYDPNREAIALYLDGEDEGYAGNVPVIYKNNEVTSDEVVVKIGGYNGGYSGAILENNLLIKPTTAQPDFRAIEIGHYQEPTIDHEFIDMRFSGTSFDSWVEPGNSVQVQFFVEWSLNVVITEDGHAISEPAIVHVTNNEGFDLQQQSTGNFRTVLKQYTQTLSGRDSDTPYELSVIYKGQTKTYTLDMTTKTVINANFDFTGILITNPRCDVGNGFLTCSNVAYATTMQGVSIDCTDDGSITGARFVVRNVDDGTIYVNTTQNQIQGSTYSATFSKPLMDSGTYEYTATCTDNSGNIGTNTLYFSVPFGVLSAVHVLPGTGVSVVNGSSFTYQVRLSCSGGECGNVSATLDPYTSFENGVEDWTTEALYGYANQWHLSTETA